MNVLKSDLQNSNEKKKNLKKLMQTIKPEEIYEEDINEELCFKSKFDLPRLIKKTLKKNEIAENWSYYQFIYDHLKRMYKNVENPLSEPEKFISLLTYFDKKHPDSSILKKGRDFVISKEVKKVSKILISIFKKKNNFFSRMATVFTEL